MRVPLEYGDNFPVPAGSWDPRVPWRFPRSADHKRSGGLVRELLPWVMLAVGMTLGVIFSWRLGGASAAPSAPEISHQATAPRVQIPTVSHPSQANPHARPIRMKSRLA